MQYTPPINTGLNIIYQDDALLVLDKPAGLLSVPGRGEDKQDCLATRVQADYPAALIVHRLDMDTSGLILMAHNKDMQRQLSIMFAQRQFKKGYIAVVDGKPEQDSGEIDLPLITDWPNRPKQKVDYEIGKPAQTLYNVLEYNHEQNSSRVALSPQTGRSHQLRVHMLAIGHAILGDRLYASKEIQEKSPRLLLHAGSLNFIHPVTKQGLSFSSEVPF